MKTEKRTISLKLYKSYSWLILFSALSNTFDGIVTYKYVAYGPYYEANPIMAALIDFSPILFLLFKLIVGNGLFYIVWKHFSYLKFGRLVVWLAFIPYAFLFINNMFGIIMTECIW